MNLSPQNLIKILELYGFFFKRSRGSHQLYYNPVTKNSYCSCARRQGFEKRHFLCCA